MKLLIKLPFLFFLLSTYAASLIADDKKIKNDLTIISVYQVSDYSGAGFDFFTSQKTHKCGGKMSNRHRSYSDNRNIAERKFQLVLMALNFQHKVTVKSLGCEGNAMLVDYIGIHK